MSPGDAHHPRPVIRPRPAPRERPDPGTRHPRASQRPSPSEAARRLRRRGLRRLAVLVTSVVSVLVLGWLLLLSPVLGVRSVDVLGNQLLTVDDVRAAAAIEPGYPLLRLDTGAAAERVRVLSPVADVRVLRSWPSSVAIEITERVALTYLATPQGVRLVDATGLEFATVATPPSGLPELQSAGAAATLAAARVLAVLAEPGRESLRAELVAVHASGPADVQLILAGARTVRWGDAQRSERKAAVLAALLTQRGMVYDVASPDLPTVR